MPISAHAQQCHGKARGRGALCQGHNLRADRLEQRADLADIGGCVVFGHDAVIARPDGDALPRQIGLGQQRQHRKGRGAARHGNGDVAVGAIKRGANVVGQPIGDGAVGLVGEESYVSHGPAIAPA